MKGSERHLVMDRVRQRFRDSGLTLEALGQKMGHEKQPKASAWQFIEKTADPRVSTLQRFCDAMNITLADLTKGL